MSKQARVQMRVVRVRDTFVGERYGAEAQSQYRAAASPPLRAVLSDREAPKQAWVAFALFVEASVLADRLFGRGDLGLCWEMGRFAATHNIGVWRSLFMRHLRPSALMNIASGLWGSHYDGGQLLSRPSGQDGLIIQILDFPEPHRSHCLSVGGWLEASLEMGPRSTARVEERHCRALGAPSCEFSLAWG